MEGPSQYGILVVDDDEAVCDSLVLLLKRSGYDARGATHGFDALLQLKTTVPAVLISDLNMPQMSGFELLSVVRRRFPQISVIAMSGAFESGDSVPGGVIADAFYNKGQSNPHELIRMVAELIRTSATRVAEHKRESAPVWIPRNGHDSHGVPYVVVTCTECLRSFPLSVAQEDLQKIQETPCLFCPNTVRYIIDFSLSIASLRPDAEKKFSTKSAGASPSLGAPSTPSS